ncbi:unnamed protein product [Caenorhabditis auriculariae]|uniref:G2/mitotic-specific cyclin-B3 n=1 Tax=Caenorhabditis auriculariae TaxID=2777116 RepID=A0A8S1HWB3_9PELO|nr:unnamed protein product [Caenorhabditis auriculariae]
MMLRSKAKNGTNIPAPDQNKKRKQETQQAEFIVHPTEPQPKKAPSKGLSELSNGILDFQIDSTKRVSKAPIKEEKENANPTVNKAAPQGVDAIQLSSNPTDPCPNFDYDAEEAGNPDSVSEYAMDIFRYYKSREKHFRIADYRAKHPKIEPTTRAILVDWLVELQETFELNHETLYNTVKILDIYLTNTENFMTPEELQRIACGAMFVAAKFDERGPPIIEDILYMANDRFDREVLFATERDVFKTINFDLGAPLSYRYLRRLGRVTRLDMATLTLARYLLEMSLLVYEYALVSSSRMAAAAYLLAMKMKDPAFKWTPVLEKYSGYKGSDVVPLMEHLNHSIIYIKRNWQQLNNIRDKYAHDVFFNASLVKLPEDTTGVAPNVIGPLPQMSYP